MKALRLKTQHIHTKRPNQKPILRQIAWRANSCIWRNYRQKNGRRASCHLSLHRSIMNMVKGKVSKKLHNEKSYQLAHVSPRWKPMMFHQWWKPSLKGEPMQVFPRELLRNIPEQPFCRTGLDLSPLNTTLPSLLVIGLIWHLMTTWLRVSWISKSLLCKVGCLQVLWKWRYNAFYFVTWHYVSTSSKRHLAE